MFQWVSAGVHRERLLPLSCTSLLLEGFQVGSFRGGCTCVLVIQMLCSVLALL